MNPLRKKTFVLLELLIGLGLVSILLALLFSFLAQNMRLGQKMEQAREVVLERQNLQTRLQDLLTSLARSSQQRPLYTQIAPEERRESLFVLFDNGIDPDPAFSGPVLGRVFLDEKQNLSLLIWPLDAKKTHPWRKEVLLARVTNISYEFLGEKQGTDSRFKPITATLGWHSLWPKERNDIPSILRLSVYQGNETLQFSFRLPTSQPMVTYREEELL